MADAQQTRLARARAQRLAGAPFASAVEAVGWFGVVQAQDQTGAGWALGQRTAGLTESGYGDLLDSGALLRTHVLRPTWHLVLPRDAGWMLALTGRRIKARLGTIHRRFGIDTDVIRRAERAFDAATADGSHRTRAELGTALGAAGVDPGGQRLPHLLGLAELDRILISGARRGRLPTWAAFGQRVPATSDLEGDAALAELAGRYFQSHGPATLADFAWWSGLSAADARRGVSAAGTGLCRETHAGIDHWRTPDSGNDGEIPAVMLLPNWDEFTVAYRSRDVLLRPGVSYDWSGFPFASILSNVVFDGGLLAGTWRRAQSKTGIRLSVSLQDGCAIRPQLIRNAADRLAGYAGVPVELAVG